MLTKHEVHSKSETDSRCPFVIHPWDRNGNLIYNWHSNIEIICALKGNVFLQYDDETIKMTEGEVSVINTNSLHRIGMEKNKEYHCIIIDNQFCKDNGIDTDSTIFEKHFASATTYALCQQVAQCYDEYTKEQSDISIAKLRSSVLLLLIDIFENHKTASPFTQKIKNKTSERYVKNVISYLANNYREKINLDQLADMCGVTKCYLSREFKKYTGQTLVTYLNLLRCRNAQRMIKSGSSITEAATSAGFDDLSYFSKTYKALLGIPPTKDKSE